MKKSKIFINGNVITVDKLNTIASAVVIQKGLITYVGKDKEALKYKNKKTELIDLEGKTLIPGFIDGHSHFFYGAMMHTMICKLSQPPLGDVESIDDIVTKMKKFISDNKIKPGKFVMGGGYDESLLKDGRTPTREDLDKISSVHPIVITHQSGHVGVFNSCLLNELGIDANTPNPEGGVYRRYNGTNKPNGIAEEKAMTDIQLKHFPKPKLWNLGKIMKYGQKEYLSNGITTAQDGGLNKMLLSVYKLSKLFHWLDLDVKGYYFANSRKDVKEYLQMEEKGKTKIGKLDLTGIKVLLDGSPQAKTAWLSKPYYVIPEGMPEDYAGYPTIPDQNVVDGIYDEVVKNKLQVLTHTNGDAASEQLLNAYEKALKKNNVSEDLRPVMIHAQTVRKDQLERMTKIGMIPSFYQMHTYFWGDWHLDSVLGPERGNNISPTKWALDLGMKFNVHCDNPVLPPNTSYMLWTAVNRKTRSGRTIGEEHKLSIMDALKAQTIWVAYEYFAEDKIGSIEVGKVADLAILDKNPLAIDVDDLKNIKVNKTYKKGKCIFKRNLTI